MQETSFVAARYLREGLQRKARTHSARGGWGGLAAESPAPAPDKGGAGDTPKKSFPFFLYAFEAVMLFIPAIDHCSNATHCLAIFFYFTPLNQLCVFPGLLLMYCCCILA